MHVARFLLVVVDATTYYRCVVVLVVGCKAFLVGSERLYLAPLPSASKVGGRQTAATSRSDSALEVEGTCGEPNHQRVLPFPCAGLESPVL